MGRLLTWCSFTNVIGFFLEARLWDVQRFKGGGTFDADKHHTAPPATGNAPATV